MAAIRGQLRALRELAWLYYQARLWGYPRRFEDTDVQGIHQLYCEAGRERHKALNRAEKAKKHLLATGYVAADSWLIVRLFGDLCCEHTAAVGDKPEMAVLTDSGADLPGLDIVLREMYVAGLKLEAKADEKADWPPQGDASGKKEPLPPPGTADDGRPFYKPKYFGQWNIGDDLLRRNATNAKKYMPGKVRRQKQPPQTGNKGKRATYRYSEPDARRLWPEHFAGARNQPSGS